MASSPRHSTWRRALRDGSDLPQEVVLYHYTRYSEPRRIRNAIEIRFKKTLRTSTRTTSFTP